jgi:hypothetical protein
MKIESLPAQNTRVHQIMKWSPALVVIVITLMLFGCSTPKETQPAQPAVLPASTVVITPAPSYVYHAVLNQTKPIVAGEPTMLNIQILDESGKQATDIEARSYGKLIYYAYVAVVPRDLASLQADPIVVDPFKYPIILQGMEAMTPTNPTDMPPGTSVPVSDVEDVKLQPKFVFPKDGQYIVFVDVKPPHGDSVVLTVPVDVGSAKTQAAALASGTALTQPDGDLKVTLKVDGALKAGQPATLNFEVVDAQGKVITEEIEPQSGENCVVYIIDETMKSFLRPDFIDHTKLQFSAIFPNPGKYKVWFEYIYGDQPRQVSYILDVK